MTKQEHQCTGPHCDNHADTVEGSTSQGSDQHMARHAQSAAKKDTSRRFVAVEGAGWSMRLKKRCLRSTLKIILK